MMGSCDKYPGEDGVAGYLDVSLFGDAVDDERLVDEIRCRQCVSNNRCRYS